MKELGFIRYGEMIRTNVKHLGLCNHVYLEGLWFTTGKEDVAFTASCLMTGLRRGWEGLSSWIETFR